MEPAFAELAYIYELAEPAYFRPGILWSQLFAEPAYITAGIYITTGIYITAGI